MEWIRSVKAKWWTEEGKPGRLRHMCDYFMALYKDKQHKDIIYDVKNFALWAKGVFSYIKNNLKPTILTHANEPSPTLYRYTYMNILIPVLFLGRKPKRDTLRQI